MAEFGLFEAMYSARSVRRIKPDPVPDEVITKVLDAAIRAPSGSNAQGWVFIVVKDAEKRRQLGAVYKKASDILTKLYAGRERPAHMDEQQYERFMRSVTHLFNHMGDVPVLLLPCLRTSMWSGAAKLPDDIILIPGVVSHCVHLVEHPELVAQRIIRFADVVGRERVIAGTDCGFGTSGAGDEVHPDVAWAKLKAMVEGARIASRRLWAH